MRQELLSGLLLVGCTCSAIADGVAYRLPPDGTWVKYWITPGEEYTVNEFRTDDRGRRLFTKVALPKPTKAVEEDLFLVRSVGRVQLDGRPHRWLELVNEPAEEGKKKPARNVFVLKLLVPEAAFRPGSDPFDHVRKMYLSDRRNNGESYVMEVKDADGRKYQLERFRALFPVPPKEPARKEGVERKTKAGTFKGYELEFDYGFEGKLFAGKKGKNTWKGHYKVVVSEAAPFGLVEVESVWGEGLEDKGDGTGTNARGRGGRMELVEVGSGAKSGLPDLK